MSRITLAGAAQCLLEVKKSRFLARAIRVETLPAALAQLDVWRVADATHNCWAARCGLHYRSADDGEPGGTAGRPILAAIDGAGLDQVLVLVIRWFGGIKLGAGGLVRAYGGAAAQCLREAVKLPLVERQCWQLRCAFEHAAAVHQRLHEAGAEKLAEDYSEDGLQLRIRVADDNAATLAVALRDATRGQIHIEFLRLDQDPAA